MVSVRQLVETQKGHAQDGGRFLGTLIWWSLNDNRIDWKELQELVQDKSFDEEHMPKAVRPTGAFRRAWRELAGKLQQEGLLLRQIRDSEIGILLGLVEETKDSVNESLDYELDVTFGFDKKTGLLTKSGTEDHPVFDKLRAAYAHHLALTTQDIRSMVTSFARLRGVSLRESGGVYFIPRDFQKSLDALGEVLHSFGSNSLYQLPLYESPSSKSVLTQVAKLSLDEEIRRVKEELEKFLAEGKESKTRDSTLKRRLDTFEKLRSRVRTFAGLLSFQSDSLTDQLQEMTEQVRKSLGLEACPAPTPEKLQEESTEKDPESSDEWTSGGLGVPTISLSPRARSLASPKSPPPQEADNWKPLDEGVGF